MSYGEDIEIHIRIVGEDQASPALEAVRGQVETLSTSVTGFGGATQEMVVPVSIGADEITRTGRAIRSAMSPLRTASRDVWTLAYAFRRLNYATGLNSEAVKGLVNVMVALGAVIRILAVIQSVSGMLSNMTLITKVATAAQWLYNAALANTAFWIAIITGGIAVIAGLGVWAVIQASQPRSMQAGGVIPETGMYMLHKGETVVPEGGPTTVIINMQTGPISSEMDADNLLDTMALRMAQESRRRRGS